MKCPYCGRENEAGAMRCIECQTEFEAAPPVDPALVDPRGDLVSVASFGDLIRAKMLKDELEAAGIEACIPEDMSSTPFGQFPPVATFTVQVAASNHAAAKEIAASHRSSVPPDLDQS